MFAVTHILTLLLYIIPQTLAYDKRLTTQVEAGKNNCFFVRVNNDETINVEFRVIKGGDLDISFRMLEPNGKTLRFESRRREASHSHVSQVVGDYCFCFDNTFSTFYSKTVLFEINIESKLDKNFGDEQWKLLPVGLVPEQEYAAAIKDYMNIIDNIRTSLTVAERYQELLSGTEARDRNIVEKNFTYVNYWSAIQLFVMIVVGLLQVYVLRSIFETNTRMSRFWRKF